MVDRLKNIPAQLLELWNKYTAKQRTMIISVAAVVIVALILLTLVMSKPNWQLLGTYGDAKEVSTVTTLLSDNSIPYSLSKDNSVVYVESKNLSNAVLLLGANNLPSTGGMTMEDLLNNSMSTTESDRKTKNRLYLQSEVRAMLVKIDGIDDAIVNFTIPDQSAMVLKKEQEPHAAVMLTTNKDFSESHVPAIVNYVAHAMGTSSLENIKVINQKGELLYSGSDESNQGINLSSTYEFQEQAKRNIAGELEGMILSGRLADDIYIVPNLKFNMDVVQEVFEEYLPLEGKDEAVKLEDYNYVNESNSNAASGIPGTESNDDSTDYLMPDESTASGSTEINKNTYQPSKRVTETIKDRGGIEYDNSTLAVSLRRYKVIREVDLKNQGLLDDTTYEEYKLANSNPISMTEDESSATLLADVKALLANASGISADDIYVTLYDIPVFQDNITAPIPWSLYLQIAMFVLIAGLLIFVVLKGTAPVEVTELEPELSVEQLLATTKENQSLDDIEFSDKSESRKMIEKFVDENPQAVAQLLRNWLNEDWEG